MNINKNDTLNSVEHIVYARLAILSYGLDSNVTKLLANLLTKLNLYWYYFANCIV